MEQSLRITINENGRTELKGTVGDWWAEFIEDNIKEDIYEEFQKYAAVKRRMVEGLETEITIINCKLERQEDENSDDFIYFLSWDGYIIHQNGGEKDEQTE